MEYYLYSVEMPISGLILNYRELSSKEQLVLAKANVLLPLDKDNVENYAKHLKKILSDCVENKSDFDKLNIIEYLLFAIKMRTSSLGDELILQTQEEVDGEIVKIKFNIGLSKLIYNIFLKCKDLFLEKCISEDNINVYLDWPNHNTEKDFYKLQNLTEYELIRDSTVLFINYINLYGKIITFSDFSLKQKSDLFDKLPGKIRLKIQSEVFNNIKKFSELDFIESSKKEYLKINFYNWSFQNFLRLMFADNLKNIYQQYYLLASKKISLDYVDNLTVAERNVYFSFIEEEYENRKQSQNSEGGGFSSFDDGLEELEG